MAEIARIGQPDTAIGPRHSNCPRIELGCDAVVRSDLGKKAQNSTNDGADGRDRDCQSPVGSTAEGNEVRQRRPHCQSADQQADEKASVLQAPSDGDLHADRIDARQQGACQKARDNRQGAARFGYEKNGIHQCGSDGGHRKDPARIEPVGNPEYGGNERTNDKSGLYAAGQSSLSNRRHRDFTQHVRKDCCGQKPQRHRQDLA